MKENMKQVPKSNLVKMLRYAAAAFSMVSFLTTLNGIKGIVTESVWIAGLISFGVQAVILVMGLWSIPAITTMWERQIAQWLKWLVTVLMVVLYLCATAFSSFFSYVYMSNAAYAGVQPVDYNMELEFFLVENTRMLRNYNDAVCDVLLQNIRQTAPEFRTLMETYHQTANDKIQQIINGVSKYEVSTIPDDARFHSEDAVTAYEAANRRTANESLTADCKRLEQGINQYITYYNEQHYPAYLKYYNDLMAQADTTQAEARKAEIENLIQSMQNDITHLSKFGHTIGSIEGYVNSICNGIVSQYNHLITSLNSLKNGYDEILAHPDIVQGGGLTLQNFYETVYSPDMSTQEKLNEARNDLQQVVSSYIQSSEGVNEESISSLVECIGWLDKLNQSRVLRSDIEQFETNNLKKTYIISDHLEEEKADTQEENSAPVGIKTVNTSTWNTIRHTDVMEFISLVKSFPDINQILWQDISGENDSAITLLNEMEQNDYVSSTLAKAYRYSRSRLENISDMERARNYLSSENSFLAFLCLLIAIFLDVAAFLIGLYMYACQNRINQEPNLTL